MIVLAQGDLHFNLRIAGLCIHGDHAFLHRIADQPFWCLPGGRAELLESSDETLRREMREELGCEVRVERLLWIVENFFRFDGRQHHELGLYYLMTLPADSGYLDVRQTWARNDLGVPLTFRWFSFSELPTIRMLPSFLGEAIRQLPEVPQHIVHRDE